MQSSEALPLLLAIGLDLQIRICTFLHPSSILALRMTCKILQSATKQRIIWINALHRVCLYNTLFLASFPIPDMSDLELEQAAIAPHKWIKLCANFAKQHSLDSDALGPTTTRNIRDPLAGPEPSTVNRQFFLVPGGRYLVRYSLEGMGVLDLGYTPTDDCKLLASVGPEGGTSFCLVNSTSDGMGLIIATFPRYKSCTVYEIYPQSETPELTQIAHLESVNSRFPRLVISNQVIWYNFNGDKIIFRVWNYRLNHSINFFARIGLDRFTRSFKVLATNTRIIAITDQEIFIWSIPPLSPQPPDFLDQNPTHVLPLQIILPKEFISNDNLHRWQSLPSWYSGSPQALYFNALCQDLKIHDFNIDLTDGSLHIINTCQLPLFDPDTNPLLELDSLYFETPGFGEDALVSLWDVVIPNQCRVHIRSTSSHTTSIISPGVPIILNLLLSGVDWGQHVWLCPATGRAVHVDGGDNHRIVVVDFLPYL